MSVKKHEKTIFGHGFTFGNALNNAFIDFRYIIDFCHFLENKHCFGIFQPSNVGYCFGFRSFGLLGV